ncbi:MAG: hypothetical protein ACPGTQ_00830 [Colwellia sp.]
MGIYNFNKVKIVAVKERRRKERDRYLCYDAMTIAQKISAFKLRQFGFGLEVLRREENHKVAIFTCGNKSVLVNHEGDIDCDAPVRLRA